MTSSTEQVAEFQIAGMTCSNCALRIEKVLQKNPNISTAVVNLPLEAAQVRFTNLAPNEIIQLIKKVGYDATLRTANSDSAVAKDNTLSHRALGAALFALPFLWAMMAHLPGFSFVFVPHWLMHPVVQLVLALPTVFYFAWPFYRGAWGSIKTRLANMDVLVTLGVLSPFFYSVYLMASAPYSDWAHLPVFFEASAILVALILLGKWLEARTRHRSADAIRALLALRPEVAHRVTGSNNDQFEEIPAHDLRVGDLFLVRPGERIPADGSVERGSSDVDESMLTGESMPVAKAQGAPVTGGSLNMDGALYCRAQVDGNAGRLAQIVRFVSEAQLARAPIQKLADKIAAWFVPLVVLIALVVGAAWLLAGKEFAFALETAIAVVVISCPCALGLATPVSVMAATGAAARHGVLFRNSEALQRAVAVKTIFFDKTGTLTEGNIELTQTHPADGFTREHILSVAASAERESEHPLAKAVVKAARQQQLSFLPVQEFLNTPGNGVKAKVQLLQGAMADVFIGKRKFIEEQGISIPANTQDSLGVFIAINGRYAGGFSFQDRLRTAAKGVIEQLHKAGFKTAILSGDRKVAVQEAAKEAGIDKIYFELTPEQKAEAIETLQQKSPTAMVGDGVNDAPALAYASLGVAILSVGQNLSVAAESAQVVLAAGTISALPKVFEISRKTMRNIKENYFWAFFYNSMAIPLAALGYLSPVVAGVAMSLSSLTVVLNALRLRKL